MYLENAADIERVQNRIKSMMVDAEASLKAAVTAEARQSALDRIDGLHQLREQVESSIEAG